MPLQLAQQRPESAIGCCTRSRCYTRPGDTIGAICRRLSDAASKEGSLPRVYLFTKADCQLCEEAKEELEPIRHKVCPGKLLV